MPKTCIICRARPRVDTQLVCDAEACHIAALVLTTNELNEIRQREAIEALQQAPPGTLYIHITPRNDAGGDTAP